MFGQLYERRWPTVVLTPISVANSIITVSTTNALHVKQKITLRNGPSTQTDLEIKRVLSATQIQVGPIGNEMGNIINPTIYNGGTLEAEEQERNKVSNDITMRAVYQEEPAVALRTVPVDWLGRFYTTDNPFPVQLSDGSINIGTVNAEIETQLSHLDNFPDLGDYHDSVRIGGRNGPEMVVNPDGSINIAIVPTSGGNQAVPTYNEISSVPANTWTDIVQYTIPPLKKGFVAHVTFSGDNIAQYEVLVNGTAIDKATCWFSGPLHGSINFSTPVGGGYDLAAGDVVKVRVMHYRATPGTFNARIMTVINDA